MSDFDFGDDSFLEDFDPDAAIIAANKQQQHQKQDTITDIPNPAIIANKTNKVKSEPMSKSKSKSSPLFANNSGYSSGNKTNPKQFINPYMKMKAEPSPNLSLASTLILQRCDAKNDEHSKKRSSPKSKSNISNSYSDNGSTTTQTHSSSPPKKRKIHAPSTSILTSIKIPSHLQKDLTQTLSKHFGHTSFREGQVSIINSLLQKKDAAVFWSTGSGKSICYQIPPLHSNRVALVVSPLISLMEDQVSKLNGIVGAGAGAGGDAIGNDPAKNVAVFLGSGQKDPTAEERALKGEYSLIYCTPEKLLSNNGWFLDRLGKLHQSKTDMTGQADGVCLIAVDESHCVSEWGHDFRKEYRQIGSHLRKHEILKEIPIVALTATAVPRVQKDIISSLQLREPNVVKQSFDRDNLVITVKRKPAGGYRTALKGFVEEMKGLEKSKRFLHESTIVYCPTQAQVEEVTAWLEQQFDESSIRVQSYHGGQSIEHRSNAHVSFLTGRTSVIVATLAFGMGIDKTDTRRIIHYGPPKTVEEYYQQIGRAGRDGLEAYCTMYCNSGDFDKYKGDFYLGGLSASARSNQESSIDSLRRFAMSDEVCRRAELLKFFHEEPSFGERCGTCDTCQTRSAHSDDIERDFSVNGARLVLYAISILNEKQGTSSIEKVLRGSKLESYRYKNSSVVPDAVHKKVIEMKSQMVGYKKRVPVSYFTKDLLPALDERGFVRILAQSTEIPGGRSMAWTSYTLSDKGYNVLTTGEIVLPVPSSIREFEKEQNAKIEKALQALKDVGADVDQIPKHEREEGDGVVFKALRTWYNYLDLLQRNERQDRLDQLEDLRLRIDAWRMDVAAEYRIAPSDAMPDHLLLSVAYTATSLSGNTIEKEALLAAGVRSGGIDALVNTINEWIDENKGDLSTKMEAGVGNDDASSNMILPDTAFQPDKPWEFFVYRPQKKTGLASWESSYNRFTAGEHPQTIAISPISGRPIQVNTVIAHVFDGILSGRKVDLRRLSTLSTPPTKSQWDKLSRMEVETSINVVGDPKTSGKDGEVVRMTDFLAPIMGEAFVAKEFNDRTPEERASFGEWCQLFKWYSSLRRIGLTPSFATEDMKD